MHHLAAQRADDADEQERPLDLGERARVAREAWMDNV